MDELLELLKKESDTLTDSHTKLELYSDGSGWLTKGEGESYFTFETIDDLLKYLRRLS